MSVQQPSILQLSSSIQTERLRGFSRSMYLNTLIKSCANAGDLQRAEHWQRQREELGMQQNVKGFGKLMEAALVMEGQRGNGLLINPLRFVV